MKNALAPGGVISTQGECLWLHLKLIKTVLDACAEVFATVDYAFTTVPSYPSGQIGFILASNVERGEIFLLWRKFFALTGSGGWLLIAGSGGDYNVVRTMQCAHHRLSDRVLHFPCFGAYRTILPHQILRLPALLQTLR